jgi:hypothetical protein
VLAFEITDGALSGVTVADGGADYAAGGSFIAFSYPPGGQFDAEDRIQLRQDLEGAAQAQSGAAGDLTV